MSRSSHKQSGFAVLETLLIVIVLAVVAGVCWFVYKSSTDTISTLDEANKSAAVQPSVKDTTKPQKYLTIKEWGVKMPLVPAIENAIYAMDSGYVYLGISDLDNTGCGLIDSEPVGVGAITRFTADEKDPLSGGLYVDTIKNRAKVGSHYFFFQAAKSLCSQDETIMSKVTAAAIAFNAQTLKIVSATE